MFNRFRAYRQFIMIFAATRRLLASQMCFNRIVFLICIYIFRKGNTLPECKEKFKGCCVGYFWNNMTDECEVCMPGYIGENCSSRCPYPTYGNRCQGHCACDNDSCDVATGCRIPTTDLKTTSFVKFSQGAVSENDTIFVTKATKNLDINTSSVSSTNDILLNLITIFGGLDIMLMCAYLAVCVYDRREQQKADESVNTSVTISGNSSTYENVEIISFSGVINNS